MLGILCGFAAEKKIARHLSPLVACSGARVERCRLQAAWLVEQGATSLLSFGVAGGLAPGLTPRSVVIGTHVIDACGASYACDAALIQILARAAPGALQGAVYGSHGIVGTAAEKERIRQATGALIVDMESHILAEAAAWHALPFAVLRGISDDAAAPLPDAILHGIREDGSEDIASVLKSLLKNPAQLPALLHFAKNTGIALKQLEKISAQVSVVSAQIK